jgi:hypothetical protein
VQNIVQLNQSASADFRVDLNFNTQVLSSFVLIKIPDLKCRIQKIPSPVVKAPNDETAGDRPSSTPGTAAMTLDTT